MFGLGALEIAALLLLGCCFEVVLFWASASLGNAPETPFVKCLLAGLLVFALYLPAAALISYLAQRWNAPFSGTPWIAAALSLSVARAIFWPLPSLFYVPFVPVSVKRGFGVGAIQSVLGIFLYVLVGAVVLVGLAVNQIWRGDAQPKASLSAPFVAPALPHRG